MMYVAKYNIENSGGSIAHRLYVEFSEPDVNGQELGLRNLGGGRVQVAPDARGAKLVRPYRGGGRLYFSDKVYPWLVSVTPFRRRRAMEEDGTFDLPLAPQERPAVARHQQPLAAGSVLVEFSDGSSAMYTDVTLAAIVEAATLLAPWKQK
jgi:hypothetical protein